MISGERVRPWHDGNGESADPDAVYGHWDHDPQGGFVLPPYVTYSDYSGSLVERSNLEEFFEQFATHEDAEWWRVHGGHGTQALLVRVDADERVPEIGEFFDGLENYPLANRERLSELEMEATDEAWAQYGHDEFLQGLSDAGLFPEGVPDTDDETQRGASTSFYYALASLYGQDSNVEDAAGSVAFHIDEIIRRLSAFVEDLNISGEHGNAAEREASEDGYFGPATFEAMMNPALYGPNPNTGLFDYGGPIYKLLHGHNQLWYPPAGRRLVFQDLLRERGLEAGLQFLEKQG